MDKDVKAQTLGSPLIDHCWEKLNNLPDKNTHDYLDKIIFDLHCYGVSRKGYYSTTILDFVLKILSDKHLCSKSGLNMLVMHLCWDFELLTTKQRSKLLGCIVENYPIYSDRMDYEISELIVDYNTPQIALNTYERISLRHNLSFPAGLWFAHKILKRLDDNSPEWKTAMELFIPHYLDKVTDHNIEKSNTLNVFDDILFGQSYLMNTSLSNNNITFALNLALTKKHPKFKTLKDGHQKRGFIHFTDISSVDGFPQETSTELKGNLQSISYRAGNFHMCGKWGEIAIQAPLPTLYWI